MYSPPSLDMGNRMPRIFLYKGLTQSNTGGNSSTMYLNPVVCKSFCLVIAISLRLPEYDFVKMLSVGRQLDLHRKSSIPYMTKADPQENVEKRFEVMPIGARNIA